MQSVSTYRHQIKNMLICAKWHLNQWKLTYLPPEFYATMQFYATMEDKYGKD